MKEAKIWLEYAKRDFKNAQDNFKIKIYDVCIFLCQQSVEKAFKALLLKKTKRIRKIHDLVELSKEINFPKDKLDSIKELTLAYIYSRYPDVEKIPNLKEKALDFLKTAEEALKWIEKNL